MPISAKIENRATQLLKIAKDGNLTPETLHLAVDGFIDDARCVAAMETSAIVQIHAPGKRENNV